MAATPDTPFETPDTPRIKIISAGAGSGKTYRLTQELVQALKGGARAEGIIATTFTNKAAGELQERVRQALLAAGEVEAAHDLAHALIGTVHSLGVRLLRRFAYEAGVSPEVDIIAEEDHQALFNQAMANILLPEKVDRLEMLVERLGMRDSQGRGGDWRRTVRELTEAARANRFDAEVLEASKQRSLDTLFALLPPPMSAAEAQAWEEQFAQALKETIATLTHNEDETKTTRDYVRKLEALLRKLERGETPPWKEYLAIATERVGKKSRDDAAPLIELALQHERHPRLHRELREYVEAMFDLAGEALAEYQQYKRQRGLIDYTDMEVLVDRLLDVPAVQQALAAQLDLLMVDEFQDTSPIQLNIFYKLSRLARQSVWVGDPKQSIYGFRGADPALMEAVVRMVGGVQPENILRYSWRAREELVWLSNAIFTEAFGTGRLEERGLPPEQVALEPRRKRAGDPEYRIPSEPEAMGRALWHWHFLPESGRPNKRWLAQAMAHTLRQRLEEGVFVLPKGEKEPRRARPGDVAILCRTNAHCREVAEALHQAGMEAAIARTGLLDTAEARLVMACLKLLLHPDDARSTAELLILSGTHTLSDLIEDRLRWLEAGQQERWAANHELMQKLDALRPRVAELGSAEVLARLLDQLDLRRLVVRWGKHEQRLANIERLMGMAIEYEERCTRLHAAASLGGFLLWLTATQQRGEDWQGATTSPRAVNVLTYHASKGLEWPIVVCMNLGQPLRAEPWGLQVVSERENPDPKDILGGRWLRFWAQPYGPSWRKAPMGERVLERPEFAQARQQALMEEARLLYVGITRARDYLVWPTTTGNATAWLNRVALGPDNEGAELLLPDQDETPWSWQGQPIVKETRTFTLPQMLDTLAPPPPEAVHWLEPPAGRRQWPPARIEPAALDAQLVAVQEMAYAPAFAKSEATEGRARALAAFFRADAPQHTAASRQSRAEGLLRRYEVEDLDAGTLLQRADAFWQATGWQPDDDGWARLWPLRCTLHPGRPEDAATSAGQLFETTIDLFAERQDAILAIRHCDAPFADAESLLRASAGWATLTRQAL
ncbi:MAG: hypothetical protein D6818_07075, partial [Bacteroidetes bacterium]